MINKDYECDVIIIIIIINNNNTRLAVSIHLLASSVREVSTRGI